MQKPQHNLQPVTHTCHPQKMGIPPAAKRELPRSVASHREHMRKPETDAARHLEHMRKPETDAKVAVALA